MEARFSKKMIIIILTVLCFYLFYAVLNKGNSRYSRSSIISKKIFSKFTVDDLKLFYFNFLTKFDKKCSKFELFGNKNKDGGYEVCMEGPQKPETQNCHVMSFGVNNDWSFDDSMLKYGCTVDSYDPRLKLEDHQRAPGHKFHNLGLGKKNEFWEEKKWKMVNIEGAIKAAGLENKIIDVIKCDAEGAEWPFLEDLISKEIPVKQIILEIHSPRIIPNHVTREDMLYISNLFIKLKENGFVVSHSHQRNWCCAIFSPFFPRRRKERCCYEVYLYNKKYL